MKYLLINITLPIQTRAYLRMIRAGDVCKYKSVLLFNYVEKVILIKITQHVI
jgi:hypothetical protein